MERPTLRLSFQTTSKSAFYRYPQVVLTHVQVSEALPCDSIISVKCDFFTNVFKQAKHLADQPLTRILWRLIFKPLRITLFLNFLEDRSYLLKTTKKTGKVILPYWRFFNQSVHVSLQHDIFTVIPE